MSSAIIEYFQIGHVTEPYASRRNIAPSQQIRGICCNGTINPYGESILWMTIPPLALYHAVNILEKVPKVHPHPALAHARQPGPHQALSLFGGPRHRRSDHHRRGGSATQEIRLEGFRTTDSLPRPQRANLHREEQDDPPTGAWKLSEYACCGFASHRLSTFPHPSAFVKKRSCCTTQS